MRALKRKGFSDARLAELVDTDENAVRHLRHAFGVRPGVQARRFVRGRIRDDDRVHVLDLRGRMRSRTDSTRDKIIVLGGGPNRIGQGIEFDYCCVHAALALREDGYETIMINCNPETVSTDYDTSDRLYFEPLTLEDVLEIVDKEKPKGVIVQYGGQTPLKLARALEAAGAPIIGTSPDSIDLAEDRERFQKLIEKLELTQPPNRTARNADEALALAREIGYPLVVRPSYVLGGRAMEIVHDDADLSRYIREAVRVSESSPVLLDRFLDHAGRSRCRRHRRRRRQRADRRHHGAHRGSRRAFGRFVVLAAAVFADAGRSRTSCADRSRCSRASSRSSGS